MISLTRLFIHPIKSMRGLQVSHAQALDSGLAFDRTFMISDENGTFLTARQFPQMVLFTPALTAEGLYLTAPDNRSAVVRFCDFQPQAAATEVWGQHFTSQIAPDTINNWLSSYFDRPVQLRWTGQKMTRRVKRYDQIPLGFADGFPYLLINEASFRDVQNRTPAGIKMEQFRPNLIVTGAPAWDEDSWSSLRIGNVTFEVSRPCSRCILTTVSTERGRKHPAGEPLTTLQNFRTATDGSGDVDFGINLLASNSGILRAGDELTVLSRKSPRSYGAGKMVESLQLSDDHPQEISIHYQGQTVKGNNQQVLLEQLEMHGFRIPYSCRAGICGSCRMTLTSGQVKPMKQSAVANDGTILSCSCIPAGDISLA
ncbi:hypothetical protein BL250_01205 [Erwinia sp. OLTSP20]|uniref:YcbX family protein n=1 Tax=unclassified Erwinia TaxID=2622719 RepID=UPI000C18A34D|nr:MULTISPECIES: YcbX family protein [unclassified Erwinia]PIJ51345.1 hypothetical protein BV501_04740 [Erwinia sp. OAMSP11]PIJ74129.1 hypothetical protein BK416_05030 [Erwinia sp. OLSSP12]PIJ81581.1 hypothetical protein BLD47_08615 [Erwinia sp. OLCASP19]PIJ86092.1 hypothetical protein BLD46_04825 [Erwinia sp. OLMTSP26]PIJ87841.1 hypothetical protein BLD49_04825 [Erwinia sp. OLMDSP33]